MKQEPWICGSCRAVNAETQQFCEQCGGVREQVAGGEPTRAKPFDWHLDVLPGGQSQAVPSTTPHCCPDKTCRYYGVPAEVEALSSLSVEQCRDRIRALLGLDIPVV